MKQLIRCIVIIVVLMLFGTGCPQVFNNQFTDDFASLSQSQLQYIGTAARTAAVEALASYRISTEIDGMSGTYTDDEHIDIEWEGCDVGAIGILDYSEFEPGEIIIKDGTYQVFLTDETLYKNLAITVEFGDESAVDGEHGVILEIRVYEYDTANEDEELIKFTVNMISLI